VSDRLPLELSSPCLNAAGSLGYAPAAEGWALSEPQGAFVTAPISAHRRTPAVQRNCLPYPGGHLLHSGLPNPGLSATLRAYAGRWRRADLPIWVHVLPETPHQAAEMVARLENAEGVAAIELGLPAAASPADALALVQAALGELPLVISLPLHRAQEAWLAELAGVGIAALTLAAPRGALPAANGALIQGRLYGPALLPQVLAALQTLQPLGLPLIAGAGVYRHGDVQQLLAHGACAVQVDMALWKGFLFD
jgi:dihydroorotate dehydrogenase (NAD+) catalytic subunit